MSCKRRIIFKKFKLWKNSVKILKLNPGPNGSESAAGETLKIGAKVLVYVSLFLEKRFGQTLKIGFSPAEGVVQL